jgi:peptidoglycan/xylan/chitin deacetylase (PgdA/CDA1 family)
MHLLDDPPFMTGFRPLPGDFRWPDHNRLAVLLTFDTQGIVGLPPSAGQRPDFRKVAEYDYEARVGLYRVLDTLERHQTKGTFPTCGRTVELYPAACKEIIARGHEIAAHGYDHEKPNEVSMREEEAIIDRTLEAFHQVLGVRPLGYRTPYYLATDDTLPLLAARGFIWHSDFHNFDQPYFIDVGSSQVLEIPPHIDDWSHYWSDVRSPVQSVRGSPRNILVLLKDAFDTLYEESALVPKMLCLTLHPTIVGRPERIHILDEFLRHARQKPDVWWPRCIDVCRVVGIPGA